MRPLFATFKHPAVNAQSIRSQKKVSGENQPRPMIDLAPTKHYTAPLFQPYF
jgi:hypothetical protein